MIYLFNSFIALFLKKYPLKFTFILFKVYYAIKKETGKEYAIKAFNKEVLSSQNFGKVSV